MEAVKGPINQRDMYLDGIEETGSLLYQELKGPKRKSIARSLQKLDNSTWTARRKEGIVINHRALNARGILLQTQIHLLGFRENLLFHISVIPHLYFVILGHFHHL
jgi:hypothetical protein